MMNFSDRFRLNSDSVQKLLDINIYKKKKNIAFQQIRKPDQLLPYFVMESSHAIPGLPGLFVSGVFSAALRYRESHSHVHILLNYYLKR